MSSTSATAVELDELRIEPQNILSTTAVSAQAEEKKRGDQEERKDPTVAEADANAAEDETGYPSGFNFAVIFTALALSHFLIGIDSGIFATAIPSITNHFHTISDIGWYYSAFGLTACSFQFLFGKLYTVFSTKTVFLVAVVVFEIGNLVSGLAPTSIGLVIGRGIAGFGCAGLGSDVYVIITQTVPLRRRPVFAAAAAAFEGIAMITSPLLGGVITDTLSWRWCFLINVPAGAFTFIALLIFFKNVKPVSDDGPQLLLDKIRKLDLIGTAIFFPAITLLLIALQWGGMTYGWGNARVVVLLILSPILISIFVWWQWKRKEEATLPPRIMFRRSMLASIWFAVCLNSTVEVLLYYLPTYFQAVKEVSAAKSGVLIFPIAIGLVIAALISGSLTSLIGFYTPFMILSSVLVPIAAGLLTTLMRDTSTVSFIGYEVLLGLGCGFGVQAPVVAAQATLDAKDVSVGIASIIFMQMFGPTLFVSIGKSIFTDRLLAEINLLDPSLNATFVEDIGLTDLRRQLGNNDLLAGALQAYDRAIVQTFYLPVALACLSIVGALAIEWRSVKQKTS